MQTKPERVIAVSAKGTGKDVNYYLVDIPDPKRLSPYTAECEDIIEALGMTFAEGNAFKAIWRSCAARTLGLLKPGHDSEGIYDAEKVVYYGGRMIVQRKRDAERLLFQEDPSPGDIGRIDIGKL